MEIGLYTFGDITPDPATGKAVSVPQRYREMLEAARLADEAGLDVFGIGEHHRFDIPVPSPAIVMAAIGGMTKRIRLASAVTILSTLDPVRVFEDFACVDLTSSGRAEIIVGRGAYTESFSTFGYDIADYDALFAEHLSLLMEINRSERVTWAGKFRTPLNNAQVPPRPLNGTLPIWVGVGGTLASAERAGRLGLPLALANISQPPAKFAPQIEAYRRIGQEARHDPKQLRVAVTGHLHIRENSQEAKDGFYPYLAAYFRTHAPDSSYQPDVSRETYDGRAAPTGSLFVGSPQEIIDKVMYERGLFGHDRFLAQLDIGGLPYARVAKTIELLATKVAPVLRKEG